MTARLVISEHDQLGGLGADDHAQYVLVDGSRAMTGPLTIAAAAPAVIFTDTDVGHDDWQIAADADNFVISNLDGYTAGLLIFDHFMELFPNHPNTAAFTSSQAFIHQPTLDIAVVSNLSIIRDLTVANFGGIFSSFSVITAQPTLTNQGTSAGAVYLFVSQGVSKSNNVSFPPAAYRSFDHRGIIEADGAAVPNCASLNALTDIGMVRAINSGSLTVDIWVTAGNASVPSLGVVSATLGASATVTDRVVFEAVNTNLNGDGGTEAITNQYGLRVGSLTSATAINCGAWIAGASGAAANYGIVLASSDLFGGAIWFGAAQNSKIGYDGTDLVITAANVRTTAALEIDGALNHDGATAGFFGTAPAAQAAAYTPSNVTADRSYDANSTTIDELADVLGTLIADLQSYGLVQ
jgi:hypothetical protein